MCLAMGKTADNADIEGFLAHIQGQGVQFFDPVRIGNGQIATFLQNIAKLGHVHKLLPEIC